ncbi:flagellar hook-associated protein FlgK [Phyllobacterium phragmitis]|uniref:Flagellar hook-associated protein 1 n=1 Tax=Phyllobacterium phragmitis TaxID=2670329 RepID=A0A2S9IQ64_9HYPH|nr:flagellar hook-associated protein FlgK [Phyllobacterium phragmitis]PRD42660.1 flagellar hook-associated protein FlgK [Phyllobacterium phragmitis]
MSLSSALLTAQSSLSATSKQTALISKNIAGASDPNYVKRTASLVSGAYGSVYVNVSRSADEALLTRYIQTNSQSASSNILTTGLNRLSSLYSADDYSGSPAALIGDLRDALQTYAAQPGQSTTAGDTVVDKAVGLANALNEGTSQIQTLRADADADIAASVDSINDLLAKFEQVNSSIVNGTRSGADVSDFLDQRDSILKQLSGEIGITTMSRADNDMVIFAETGVTLFEKTARKVSFEPTVAFATGTSGNNVYVDGVPLSHSTFEQPYGTGRLSGLLQLRDQVAPDYQSQLDEIARSLVTLFSETDQTSSGLPAITGLFSYSGSPDVPADGTLLPGIAGTIRISSAYIRSEGGSSELLRDGGGPDNDPAYVYNSENSAGFSDRLQQLIGSIGEPRSYDPAAGGGTNLSVIDYSSASTSWLEGKRQTASANKDYNSTVSSRAEQALSNASGVDINEEMALLLQLEQSFQASSRVLSTVGSMLDDLLAAVR